MSGIVRAGGDEVTLSLEPGTHHVALLSSVVGERRRKMGMEESRSKALRVESPKLALLQRAAGEHMRLPAGIPCRTLLSSVAGERRRERGMEEWSS